MRERREREREREREKKKRERERERERENLIVQCLVQFIFGFELNKFLTLLCYYYNKLGYDSSLPDSFPVTHIHV